MSEEPNEATGQRGIGPNIDPEEIDDARPADAAADDREQRADDQQASREQRQRQQAGADEQAQQQRRSAATGRTGQFVAPLRTPADADAIAQRISQLCLVALQRGEADTVEITFREAVTIASNGDAGGESGDEAAGEENA